MPSRLRTLLTTDAGLTVLLVSLAVLLFVIYPFVTQRGAGRVLASAVLTLVLLAGIATLRDRRTLLLSAAGFGTVALVAHWLGHVDERLGVVILGRASTIVFLTLLAAGVLVQVLRPGRITRHRLEGAIAVYLLTGLIWAFAYSLVELSQPGAFHLADTPASPEEWMDDFVYFSFVTLTTLGYGDITPQGSAARNLAVLEALVGQLYVGILIARLVSLQIASASLEQR